MNLLGQASKYLIENACGATRLDGIDHPLCAYQHMQTIDNGESAPSHILGKDSYIRPLSVLFALRSPFREDILCCDLTIRSSLIEKGSAVLTLPQRFRIFIHSYASFVNRKFKLFHDVFAFRFHA